MDKRLSGHRRRREIGQGRPLADLLPVNRPGWRRWTQASSCGAYKPSAADHFGGGVVKTAVDAGGKLIAGAAVVAGALDWLDPLTYVFYAPEAE